MSISNYQKARDQLSFRDEDSDDEIEEDSEDEDSEDLDLRDEFV
jgi:hypothetical protein